MAIVDNFTIEEQNQSQWCWAAVSVCVFRHFNDLRWPQQCDLVNDVFRDTLFGEDCCQGGSVEDCDRSNDIGQVMALRGHLALRFDSGVSFDQLMQQIAQEQAPVVLRVQFSDGITDHFIAVIGCAIDEDGEQHIQIADPSVASGNISTYEWKAFPENYSPGSSWMNTYFTKSVS